MEGDDDADDSEGEEDDDDDDEDNEDVDYGGQDDGDETGYVSDRIIDFDDDLEVWGSTSEEDGSS